MNYLLNTLRCSTVALVVGFAGGVSGGSGLVLYFVGEVAVKIAKAAQPPIPPTPMRPTLQWASDGACLQWPATPKNCRAAFAYMGGTN